MEAANNVNCEFLNQAKLEPQQVYIKYHNPAKEKFHQKHLCCRRAYIKSNNEKDLHNKNLKSVKLILDKRDKPEGRTWELA